MFDEYFNPPKSVVSLVHSVADPTDSPSSISIDQDAPSASTSPTQETQSPIILQGVEEQLNENETTPFDNDPFLDILTFEPNSQESSLNVQPANPPFEHLKKWTKNYHL
ncbi:hypothetical protein Tco_0315505 [Tanacetum coccineum]